MEFSSAPDLVVEHIPEFCTHCGCSLSDIQAVEKDATQVSDLPEIKPRITEHRIFTKQCTCGHNNELSFPKEVLGKTSYGPRICALIAY